MYSCANTATVDQCYALLYIGPTHCSKHARGFRYFEDSGQSTRKFRFAEDCSYS